MKLVLILFLLFFSKISFAKPFWEINNSWICKTFLHSIINKNGNIEDINKKSNFYTFDFNTNTAFTGFSNFKGKIIILDYDVSKIFDRKFSLFKVTWEDNDISYFKITETDDRFFTSGQSGYRSTSNKIWSAHYECFK